MEGRVERISEISIFKIKDGFKFNDVINHEVKVRYESSLEERCFKENGFLVKMIFFQTKRLDDKNPPWLSFFNEKLDDHIESSTYSIRPSGVLYLEKDEQSYICPFGYSGKTIFHKNLAVSDFGIKVAMNMCGNKKVRQTKSKIHDYKTRNINRHSSLATDTYFFDIDEIEMLSSISAHPEENSNVTLVGKDHLRFKSLKNDKLSWVSLFEFVDKLESFYSSDNYKVNFPNFDNYREVGAEKSSELDCFILNALAEESENSSIHLSIPEFLSDDDFSYIYKSKNQSLSYAFLDIKQIKDPFNFPPDKLDIEELKKRYIFAYDSEREELIPSKKWRVYDCIVFEVCLYNKMYVLSGGIWREIDNDFYKKIISKSDEIIEFENNSKLIDLVDLDTDPDVFSIMDLDSNGIPCNSEKSFNVRYSQAVNSSIMFDRSKLGVSGSNKVYEFCDILVLNDDVEVFFIHAKRHDRDFMKVFDQVKFYSESVLRDLVLYNDVKEHINKNFDKIGKENHGVLMEFFDDKHENFFKESCHVVIWMLYENKKRKLSLMERYDLIKTRDEVLKLGFGSFQLNFILVSANQKISKAANISKTKKKKEKTEEMNIEDVLKKPIG